MGTNKIEENSTIDAFSEDGRRKVAAGKLGTLADQRDMYRMGKTPKLRVSNSMSPVLVNVLTHLQRNFGFFSIFGFSMILLSTWETSLGLELVTQGLVRLLIQVAGQLFLRFQMVELPA